MEFVTEFGGGAGYFKPEEHVDAKALLVEPKKFLENQPGKFGTRDIIEADITVFNSTDMLEGKVEPIVLSDYRVTASVLVKDFAKNLKKAVICKVTRKPSNQAGRQPFWVAQPVDKAVQERVVAYGKKREEELQKLLAGEDTPDWMTEGGAE